jgi:hypothetical protein
MSTIPGQKIEHNRDIPTVEIRYVPRRQTTPTATKSTNDRLPILMIVNAKAIRLEDAKGLRPIDKGIGAKFVLDPPGLLAKAI